MNENKKLMSGIKSKLVAAICMLLVAVIMVVSSTYAWFTLSTAPEVTGITTAVGANGALEIALLPEDGILANIGTGSSGDIWTEKNTTWGNLVDLKDFYGLEQITLYPSILSEDSLKDEAGNITQFPLGMLQFPTYGSDGRVSELSSNVSSAVFNENKFTITGDNKFGVRAIGTSSGLTDREISYRDARSMAATAVGLAKKVASSSLSTNGGSLADLAIKHFVATEGADTYDSADVAVLKAVVNSLYGTWDSNGNKVTKGSFDYIQEAAMNYVLAFVASGYKVSGTQIPDAVYSTVEGYITVDATLETFVEDVNELLSSNDINESITVLIPELGEIYDLLYTNNGSDKGSIDQLAEASTELAALNVADGITWTQISAPMYKLVDVDEMTLNGYALTNVKSNIGDIVSSVTNSGGLILRLGSGAGVYSDIADCCSDYTASINISEVTYSGVTLKDVKATMQTASDLAPNNFHFTVFANTVKTAGTPAVSDTAGDKQITEFYGYVIDLAFRTNAASSNLLLQTLPVDRIYDDNSNDETMGHGASMTFTMGTGVSLDMAKNLMANFRIVFFTPGSEYNTVLATARLDATNATVDADNNVTAYMYLCEYEYNKDENGNICDEDDAIVYWYDSASNKYYSSPAGESGFVAADEVEDTSDAIILKTITNQSEAIITPLTQNDPTSVSVLVYIDGETIENADVAATVAQSLSGTMNLQFSSDADLVPAEDGNLHTTVTVQDETIAVGEETTLAEDGAVTFTSDNTEKLTVTDAGVVNAIAATDASKGEVVTVTAKNSEGKIIKKWAFTITEAASGT